jgi:hypothetical protein
MAFAGTKGTTQQARQGRRQGGRRPAANVEDTRLFATRASQIYDALKQAFPNLPASVLAPASETLSHVFGQGVNVRDPGWLKKSQEVQHLLNALQQQGKKQAGGGKQAPQKAQPPSIADLLQQFFGAFIPQNLQQYETGNMARYDPMKLLNQFAPLIPGLQGLLSNITQDLPTVQKAYQAMVTQASGLPAQFQQLLPKMTQSDILSSVLSGLSYGLRYGMISPQAMQQTFGAQYSPLTQAALGAYQQALAAGNPFSSTINQGFGQLAQQLQQLTAGQGTSQVAQPGLR